LGITKGTLLYRHGLAAFTSDYGLPQERFYNLLCLAVGAHREVFADLEAYLPSTRSPRYIYEYRTLVHAFDKAFSPHTGDGCQPHKPTRALVAFGHI
jgi:hypothetical protein